MRPRTTVRVMCGNRKFDEVGNMYHRSEMALAALMVGKCDNIGNVSSSQ
jgi:hypothetical protein